MSDDEPHEYPKPEYSPQFAEPPSEAYERGVNDGIAWVCNEAQRRFSPEGYKMEIALNRLRQDLAAARAEISRLKEASEAECAVAEILLRALGEL